jgi:hypothetical protein
MKFGQNSFMAGISEMYIYDKIEIFYNSTRLTTKQSRTILKLLLLVRWQFKPPPYNNHDKFRLLYVAHRPFKTQDAIFLIFSKEL